MGSAAPAKLLGPVLVTGGCGFLGYTLVRHLLSDPDCEPVHVVDRATTQNRHVGAHYVEADISNRSIMHSLLDKIQPKVIFHLASPSFCFPTGGRADFYRTNVSGTETLLDLATKCSSVKAFVYCSSVEVYSGGVMGSHRDVDETHDTCLMDKREMYHHTRAVADKLVLAASGSDLRTVSLRLAHMGENVISIVSVDNAAAAHILVAKALVDPGRAKGRVDGEAFNIAEEEVRFWDHSVSIWNAARGRDVTKELYVVPTWLARFIFWFVGWAFWVFTLGFVEPPPNLSPTALSWAVRDHTYSARKARERLGFRPVLDHDGVVRRAVEEEMQRREGQKGKKA